MKYNLQIINMKMRGMQLVYLFLFLIMAAVITKPVNAQAAVGNSNFFVGEDFEYTYQGVELRYEIISLPGSPQNGTARVIDVDTNQFFPYGEIKIPAAVTYSGSKFTITEIGKEAFAETEEIYQFTLPDTITRIGEKAFYNCFDTAIIALPTSLKSIGKEAFEGCSTLTSITLPAGLKVIEDDAFSDCDKLSRVVFDEGLNYIGYRAFSECDSLVSVALPEGLENIGIGAFWGCDALKDVTFPKSLRTVGKYAFWGTPIETMTLPEWVTVSAVGEQFKYQMGEDVTKFLSLRILSDATGSMSGTAVLEGYYTSGLVTGKVVLPSAVIYEGREYTITELGEKAFYDFKYMEGITLPEKLERIGKNAFYNCIGLKQITILGSVKEIGDSAFYNCKSLKKITLPKGMTRINRDTFNSATSLESVTIPGTVKAIGEGAFRYCKISTITIPEGVTTIGAYAFNGCGSLKKIRLPDSVTGMGHFVFAGCTSLTEVVLPKNMKVLEGGTFTGCFSLKSIKLPEKLTVIRPSAFSECKGLEKIFIPAAVTEIGDVAFENCIRLQKLELPQKVKKIGENAFLGTRTIFSVMKKSYAVDYLKKCVLPYSYSSDSASRKIALEDIVLGKKNTILLKGDKISISVQYYPYNTTDSKKVTWRSSNTKVAVVDSKGRVTAMGRGTATITAIAGRRTATTIIRVNPDTP